jgi:predicted phosphodiesterase
MKIVRRGIVIPDQHFPIHSQEAVNCVLRAIELVKPDIFINLGDVGEWESVSPWKYKGNRKRPPLEYVLPEVEKEIKAVNDGLDQFDEACEKAGVKQKYMVTGNHDIWLDFFVERYPYLKDYKFREACKMKERKYKYYGHNEPLKIGKLAFIHGAFATTYHAKKHLETYGENIMYGHTHDVQRHTLTKLGGTIGAWSMGCLKDMSREKNQWLRGRLHNWNHAFGIIDWFERGTFKVDVVEIVKGVTSVWGEVIDGNAKKSI